MVPLVVMRIGSAAGWSFDRAASLSSSTMSIESCSANARCSLKFSGERTTGRPSAGQDAGFPRSSARSAPLLDRSRVGLGVAPQMLVDAIIPARPTLANGVAFACSLLPH